MAGVVVILTLLLCQAQAIPRGDFLTNFKQSLKYWNFTGGLRRLGRIMIIQIIKLIIIKQNMIIIRGARRAEGAGKDY